MNLLLTSIGKRIELVEHLKSRFRVIGVDASVQNPAKRFVDAFYQIPRCGESGYAEELLAICKKEEISLLVPLYEPEFAVLDNERRRFEEIGVKLLLSDKTVLAICGDKRKTAAFFEKYGIFAPKTFSAKEAEEMIAGKEADYPFVLKPVKGMGSEGVYFAKNQKELAFFYEYAKGALVQKCVSGTEYTIDVLCDFYGEPVYIVPRVRLEVISGEVSKSRVDLRECIIEETKRLLAALQKEGNLCGPLTVQCFLCAGAYQEISKDEKEIAFIEINPRFGGGVPLSFAAGANYAAALEKMGEGFRAAYRNGTLGKEDRPDLGVFREKEIKELTMLRYSKAIYEE